MKRTLVILAISFLQACASNTPLQESSVQGSVKAFESAMVLYSQAQSMAELNSAIKQFEFAESLGSIEAEYQLGLIYFNGQESLRNINEAFKRFNALARQGHSGAQNKLGFIYHRGLVGEEDLEKAVYWFSLSAKQQNPYGQYNLSVFLSKGEGIKKNVKRSLDLRELSAEAGFDKAQEQLGIDYLESPYINKDPMQAKAWFEKAAQQGNLYAQNRLANMYREGEGVKKSPSKAIQLLANAASQNNPLAQYNLAMMYMFGEAGEIDYSASYSLLLSVYRNKESRDERAGTVLQDALYELGRVYQYGLGQPKDIKKAIEWYKKAVKLGGVRAKYNLAIIYFSKEEGVENFDEGYALFLDVAESKDEDYSNIVKDSMFRLGLAYQFGMGKLKDMQQALIWFEKASLLGHSEAEGRYVYLSTEAGLKEGIALLDAGNAKAAETVLKRAIELRGKYVEPKNYIKLGEALARQKKERESLEAFSSLVELAPDDFNSHGILGYFLAEFGRWGEAVQSYEKALELEPSSKKTQDYLTLALIQKKNEEELLKLKRKFGITADLLHSDSTQMDIDRRLNRGLKFLNPQNAGKAEVIFRGFVKFRPDLFDAYQYLGLALGMQGKHEDSIEYLEYAIKLGPNDANLYGNLGFSYEKIGRLNDAVVSYEKALSLDPSHRNTHINLQRVRKQL